MISYDEYDEDNEYDYIDECDLKDEEYYDEADILSASMDKYGREEEEYETRVLSAKEDDTKYPPARALADSWGFVDSDNLIELLIRIVETKCITKKRPLCITECNNKGIIKKSYMYIIQLLV
ncbi:hypothetical protein HPULCUR_007824 [Helicostylum pulchrum]|uniref:Uncharacterized protein n=1 Tax=Helicostylum pulchrum TaxID=562976 RepID=A0ABP9Y6K2_9FUNG